MGSSIPRWVGEEGGAFSQAPPEEAHVPWTELQKEQETWGYLFQVDGGDIGSARGPSGLMVGGGDTAPAGGLPDLMQEMDSVLENFPNLTAESRLLPLGELLV